MPKPNRNVEGNYRYGYQGEFAEKEPEIGSGINSFKLRLYDSRIGRWVSPDPYGQFHSPYLAMNNNPVSFADSDGGCTTKGGRPCAFSVMGGTATDAGGNVWSGAGDTASALHTPFQLGTAYVSNNRVFNLLVQTDWSGPGYQNGSAPYQLNKYDFQYVQRWFSQDPHINDPFSTYLVQMIQNSEPIDRINAETYYGADVVRNVAAMKVNRTWSWSSSRSSRTD